MHCMPSGLATKAEGRGADVEANKTDRQRGSRDRASERPAGRPVSGVISGLHIKITMHATHLFAS